MLGRIMERANHGWRTGVTFVFAIGLVVTGLALALTLGFGQPAPALAQSDTPCDQTDLQAALTAGQATITFAPGCTIDLTSALTIGAGANITIDGNGLVLNGQIEKYDVVDISDTTNNPSTFSLNGVTVENGQTGISDVNLAATVNVENVTASHNSVSGIAGGSVTVTSSSISNNGSGGILAGTSVMVTDSTVSDNGQIGIAAGTTSTGTATATVTGSTVSGNGLDGIFASGTATVTNSTVSGNGGIGIYAGTSMTVTFSTISDNGSIGIAAGADPYTAGPAYLTATILAGQSINCSVVVHDGGYNLSTDNYCHFSNTGSQSNVGTASLSLLPLANYGGPTQTIALGPSSIAIDAIPVNNQGQCLNAAGQPITGPDGQPITTDQRGVTRPQGTKCDIGAFELNATTFRICPSQPALQRALDNAPTDGRSYRIILPSGCTISLTQPLTIGAGVRIIIDGNGLTLDGGNQSFDIIAINDSSTSPSTLTLDQVTIEDGINGIVNNSETATVNLESSTVDGNLGDGIHVGTVTVTNSTVTGNGSAGIAAAADATVTLSTISGNGSNGITAGSLTVTASILADNVSGNCQVSSAVYDGGYNLSTDNSCGFSGAGSQNDVSSAALNLQPLADNGGPTKTIALGLNPKSIAVDLIPLNSQEQCLNAAGQAISDPLTGEPITTDQRGEVRPEGTGCDAGAYEAIPSPATVSPACSQAALQSALNGGLGSIVTINMPSDCTIQLAQSALTVGPGETITINGNGLVLDGGKQGFDIIDIDDNSIRPATLTLNQTTIENGNNGIADTNGSATVNINSSTVSDNTLDGIATNTITITDSTVSHNGANGVNPGISATVTKSTVNDNGLDGIGGGFNSNRVAESVTVAASTVSGNGFYGIDAVSVTVSDSTVSGNDGGIASVSGATVTNSSVSENGSGGKGFGIVSVGTATVTNSTVSGNQQYGMYVYIAKVTSSTISGNQGVGLAATSGSGKATMTATILAGNTDGNCGQAVNTDGGYNLSTDGTCGFSKTGSQNNVNVTALNLLPLGNYGGPTETQALGPGSVAIDYIATNVCSGYTDPATGKAITTDQRGIDRPQGAGCDVGAYEAPAVTVSTTPAKPASSGWYNASQLGTGGTLPVSASFTGLAPAQVADCTGATFTGLPSTASALNGTASGTVKLADRAYTISCGVSQGGSSLGVSQQSAQPISIKIDTTPPTITIATPKSGAIYVLGSTVDADYSCTDPKSADGATGSGIASANGCVGSVPNGQPLDTSTIGQATFAVKATDAAGNTITSSITFNVGYQITSVPGSTTTVTHGYFVLIRIAPEDANGHDYASRILPVTSTELDGPNGQVITFVHPFQFATITGKPGYQLELNTRNLSTGSWTLRFTIGNSPVLYSVSFKIQ